ncbi:MAG TPA: response regulator [Burkholderiales bacterium]|nr:response regulator [Burkholderiales bacterium]
MHSIRPKNGHTVTRALYIVESDVAVREGLTRLAASHGFQARPCASAEAFLLEASSGNAACAVVDISGADLRDSALRARLTVLALHLPIIALSSRDDPQAQRRARELGARAFFRKPVDAAALLDSIDWVTRRDPPA